MDRSWRNLQLWWVLWCAKVPPSDLRYVGRRWHHAVGGEYGLAQDHFMLWPCTSRHQKNSHRQEDSEIAIDKNFLIATFFFPRLRRITDRLVPTPAYLHYHTTIPASVIDSWHPDSSNFSRSQVRLCCLRLHSTCSKSDVPAYYGCSLPVKRELQCSNTKMQYTI